jgi:RNA-directed DNA polymerase
VGSNGKNQISRKKDKKMNTIRQLQFDQLAGERRSLDALSCQSAEAQVTEAAAEDATVVGGSGSGQDGVVNAGDLLAGDVRTTGQPAGVRVAIVAPKSGNSDGAKGDRKANASREGLGESTPSTVPAKDKQEGEAPRSDYGAQRGVWSEKMLAALHKGVKGNKWFSLSDKIARLDVLQLAWAKVHSNAGACGVDGITVERFAKDSQKRLLAVKKHLDEGSYQPQPVKRVWIPKPGSAEKRPLGIPTVRDRVVQTALRMVLEPIFEREFAEHSYGFRPGRSCQDALRRVEALLKSGQRHVVDIDIKGYFDSIPQTKLLELVAERMVDGRVLKLIGAFLKQGVLEELSVWEPESGTPQGGVVSPLLANIYLNPLDWLLAKAGLETVRYADDMVVLCRDPHQAEQALETVRGWMTEAGLELHPQKTRIVSMSEGGNHFDFLGYRFWCSKKNGKLRRLIRPKSKQKLREKLKRYTRRTSGKSLPAIIAKINPILRGWYGYFRKASASALGEMDGWVRGRLRSILRKRRKGKGRGRGLDHQRWGNGYFAELGLFCLEQALHSEIASLRRGVTC